MHKKLKTPYYGTTNLHKWAETWIWVVTDVQNFALRAPCALTPKVCRGLKAPALSKHPHQQAHKERNPPPTW